MAAELQNSQINGPNAVTKKPEAFYVELDEKHNDNESDNNLNHFKKFSIDHRKNFMSLPHVVGVRVRKSKKTKSSYYNNTSFQRFEWMEKCITIYEKRRE